MVPHPRIGPLVVERLGPVDLAEVFGFLDRDPVLNVYLAALVLRDALAAPRDEYWGVRRDGALTALLHVGGASGALLPLGDDPQALRLLGMEALRNQPLGAVLPAFEPRWRAWRDAGGGPGASSVDLEARGKEVRARLLDTGTEDRFTVVFVEDMTRSREQAQQLKLAALGRLTSLFRDARYGPHEPTKADANEAESLAASLIAWLGSRGAPGPKRY